MGSYPSESSRSANGNHGVAVLSPHQRLHPAVKTAGSMTRRRGKNNRVLTFTNFCVG